MLKIPEKKTVLLSNGETYAYLDQGEDSQNGERTFLFVHGNSSSSMHFLPLFQRMEKTRLVAPDIRGFGDSTYNSGFSSLKELADDLKLFTGALGISKAHVIGWSTGGGIVLELAVKYPELVSSIFLIQGAGFKGYPLFKKNDNGSLAPFENKEELSKDPILIMPALAAFEAQNGAFFEMLWNMSIYLNQKPSPEENKLYIAETLKQRNLIDLDWALINFNMSNEHNGYAMGCGTIGQINCPVTLTCADMDYVVTQAVSRDNAAAIKGSKLLEYEKCGHSPLVDCPDRLSADILAHAGIS
ncbi:MAG: alpha/beta hydrolase [Treponema sp.]|jgi:pimeloyl-ACP methyl ester carboxylesterase|nr:alpha/beta hydrolase [Treponema sp.]